MQEDMHFYGTYVLARAAGIPVKDARVIAYAAQFVDDSHKTENQEHADGGLFHSTATVHTSAEAVVNAKINSDEQRRVWVPFHFLPGGAGETLGEKLLCVKDSAIANAMIGHHLSKASDNCAFRSELIGVAAHVYMDTFSHFGFSGISSSLNGVDGDTCVPVGVRDPDMEAYVLQKQASFIQKYMPFKIVSWLAEAAVGSLGHGGVATFPDRPYLHWEVDFDQKRPGNGKHSVRDNPADYLEACERLHQHLTKFAREFYAPPDKQVPFLNISTKIAEILGFEGIKEDRGAKWNQAIRERSIYPAGAGEAEIHYDPSSWEDEKARFGEAGQSAAAIGKNSYRFHQAAALHRQYVLKELLPAHGIAVY